MSFSQSPHTLDVGLETVDADLADAVQARLPQGVTLTLKDSSVRRGAVETTFISEFALQVAVGVSAQIVTSFVMDTIRARFNKIRIGGERVTSAEQCRSLIEQTTPGPADDRE